jgi:hypothetical protein
MPNDNLEENLNFPHLFVSSAKDKKTLNDLSSRYIEDFEKNSSNIENLCYTAAVGRDHFKYRSAIIAKDLNELREKLKTSMDENKPYIQKKEVLFVMGELEDSPMQENNLESFFLMFPSFKETFEDIYQKFFLVRDETSRKILATHVSIVIFVENLAIRVNAISAYGLMELAACYVLGVFDAEFIAKIINQESWSDDQKTLNSPRLPFLDQQSLNSIDNRVLNLDYWKSWHRDNTTGSQHCGHFENCISTGEILHNYYLFLKFVSDMYVQGTNINWELFFKGRRVRRVQIPPYPFNQKEFWPKDLAI